MMRDRAKAIEIVEQTRLRIREDPTLRLTLEDAAAAAEMSPSRLHQIFADVHGENFGMFVRRVRLEFACGLMRAFQDWNVTQVAFEAGFSESSDFTRSFKRQYGMAPSRWDRVRPLNIASGELKGYEDPEPGFPDMTISGFSETFSGTGAPVAIRKMAGETVAVMQVLDPTTPKNLSNGFDYLENWLAGRGQIRPERQFKGISYDSTLDTPVDVMQFELAYTVDPGCEGDGDVLIRSLPPTTVAVLPCRGGVADFIAAWDCLLRGYLPSSHWRQGSGPQIEVYYNDPRKHGMRYWDMDCMVPVSRGVGK